jgi:hypothetical protein
VVRGHRKVLAPELLPREGEVAHGCLERGDRVEALVDLAPPCPQAIRGPRVPAALRAPDAPAETPGPGRIHPHRQQVPARLGQYLGQPDGTFELRVGHGILPPRALEEHDRLEHVRLDPATRRRRLHLRPIARRSPRGGYGAAGTLGVQHVTRPERCTALELPAAALVVDEWIPGAGIDDGELVRRRQAALTGEEQDRPHGRGGGQCEQRPAAAHR